MAISFNGGKDCTVLLHLFAAVLLARHSPIPEDLQPNHDHRPIPGDERNHDNLMDKTSTTDDSTEPIDGPAKSPPSIPAANGKTLLNEQGDRPTATHHVPTTSFPYPPIKSVYITAPNPFPQLDQFVISSAERYGLDLYRFGGGMKAALEEYLGCGGGKGVRGVLVGTRRGDPNGGKPSSNISVISASYRRCRGTRADRSILALISTDTSYTQLDIFGYLAIPANTGCSIL